MTNRKNAFHAIWLLIETHLFTFVQKRNLNCFLPQLISDFFSTKLDICSEKDGFHIYFKFDYQYINKKYQTALEKSIAYTGYLMAK